MEPKSPNADNPVQQLWGAKSYKLGLKFNLREEGNPNKSDSLLMIIQI